jgi:hypothetical protein
MALLRRPGLSAGLRSHAEKAVTDLVYLLAGVGVLALFAGYAILLRRA